MRGGPAGTITTCEPWCNVLGRPLVSWMPGRWSLFVCVTRGVLVGREPASSSCVSSRGRLFPLASAEWVPDASGSVFEVVLALVRGSSLLGLPPASLVASVVELSLPETTFRKSVELFLDRVGRIGSCGGGFWAAIIAAAVDTLEKS